MLSAFNCLRLWPNTAFCIRNFEHEGFIEAGNVLVLLPSERSTTE